jgi:orotate phosphoribosyltransferase
MITSDSVLRIFEERGGLLTGHFLLTSGKHSPKFLQAAQVLQYPEIASQLGSELAAHFAPEKPAIVVGPAVGGIVLAHEVARALGARACYSEKEGDGMVLRRGFVVPAGAKVIVVEDVVTTGGSVRKTVEHLRERGANVRGIGAIVDRSGGKAQFDLAFHSLARLEIETYLPKECPLCARNVPLIEPDARRG